MKRILFVALFLSACTVENADSSSGGSGASSDATRVFNTAKAATANSQVLEGIWEGAQPQVSGPLTLTSRFEFRSAFVVIAARCTREGLEPVVVGGRTTATVTDALIKTDTAISDTKPIGSDAACRAQSAAGGIPKCDPNTAPASRTICFELTGTTLDMYQGSGNIQSFNKIAD
jgi:hypothetical protein